MHAPIAIGAKQNLQQHIQRALTVVQIFDVYEILWAFVITVTANIYAIQASIVFSILQQIAMSQLNSR